MRVQFNVCRPLEFLRSSSVQFGWVCFCSPRGRLLASSGKSGQETLEHSTVQLTSEPIDIAPRSSAKGEEIKVEEKPSFLSFLQRSKYFGK